MNSITLASSSSFCQLATSLLDTHGPSLLDHMLVEQQGRDATAIPGGPVNVRDIHARLDGLLGHVSAARGTGAPVRRGGAAEAKALARASCARQRIAHLLG